jgi:hypothetical protein
MSRNQSDAAGITRATFIQRTIHTGNQANVALVLDELTQQNFVAAVAVILSKLTLTFMAR